LCNRDIIGKSLHVRLGQHIIIEQVMTRGRRPMRRLRHTLTGIIAGATLAACAHTQPVELKNEQTGESVTCGPYPAPPLRAAANVMQQNQCIQDFEQQGFVRVTP
jgi:hypothetical protein